MAQGNRKALDGSGTGIYRTIPISRLHLDLENYRHGRVESEADAIEALCNEQSVDVLAKDIAERGTLSPLDVMGVVPMEGHPDHFVTVEGNRRACALILLSDPERAPEKYRRRLQQLSAQANYPKEVRVCVFASKAEAKQWIDLRHLGDQGGVGTKEWSTTAKQRAAGDNPRTTARDNTLAVLVLDRLEAVGLLRPDERKKVKVSTLTRYLGTPEVRAALGLHGLRELIYTHDADEVDQALHRLVLDSLTPGVDGKCPVHSRSNSEERRRYVNRLKAEGALPTTPLGEPAPPPAADARSVASRSRHGAGAAQKRGARDPDKRRHMIPSDFRIDAAIKDPVLLRLRREGGELELERFTFCATYILRAFIEHTITLFLKKLGKWREGMSDRALQQVCAKELRAIGVQGKAVTVVEKAAGDQNHAHSLHSLGHIIHGGKIPPASEPKRHFDTWRPALEAMLEYVAQRGAKRRSG